MSSQEQSDRFHFCDNLHAEWNSQNNLKFECYNVMARIMGRLKNKKCNQRSENKEFPKSKILQPFLETSKYDSEDVPQLYLCCYRFRSEAKRLEYDNVHIPLRLSLFRRVKGPMRMKTLLENRDFSYTLHKLHVALKKLIEIRDCLVDNLIEGLIKKFYANDSRWRNKIVEIVDISSTLLVRF